ncbi:hypothetical protein [Nocardioides perillae]|uniref:Uncharacterized protein n=1 Tax=Nocardioides perillae TaxID=1119534 RepID=A0A7Y9RSE4_9ACTN|nr:hypothetical protein [Nocardioides perillae]NYG55525.1 hypothetical protein [Nocardioides perillae]
MTSASDERPAGTDGDGTDGAAGIPDDQLPEDLQPGEDNPLAEPLDPDEARDDLDLGVPDPTEKLGDGPPGQGGPDGE